MTKLISVGEPLCGLPKRAATVSRPYKPIFVRMGNDIPVTDYFEVPPFFPSS
jgi:hypothetical protein